MSRRRIVGMFSMGLMVLGSGAVSGQNYPNRPIRLITTTVGSSSDFSGRLIAEGISGPLGQPVIVVNRATTIAPEVAAKATPDGYTMIIVGGAVWITPLLQKTTYDPVQDLSPITITDTSNQILVVHPSLPVKNVQELIALAKARPGQLNMGRGATATPGHLTMELFKSRAGINIVQVPYNGGPPALIALLGNEVQVLFSNDTTIMTHAKAGRLRALAISGAKPSKLTPSLPPISDSGLPGFDYASFTVMFAPAKTPATIIDGLNQEIVRVLNKADVKEKLSNAGYEVVASSPRELAATMKSNMAITATIIKDAGIKTE